MNHRQRLRWLCRAYLPVGVLAIGLTGSRGGLLTTIVALLIVPLTMDRLTPGRLVTAVVVLAGAAGLAVAYVPDKIVERLSTTRAEVQDASFGNRFTLWVAGVHAFERRPMMGHGTGEFVQAVRPELGSRSNVAHNTYLSVLVEQGIVGLTLFLTMLVAVYRSVLRLPKLERRFALLLLATLAIAMLPLTWEDQGGLVHPGCAAGAVPGVGRRGAEPPAIGSCSGRPALHPERPQDGCSRSAPQRRPGRHRMTPRVSVVTTAYNGAPYFDRAIPGILAQTFEISSSSSSTTARPMTASSDCATWPPRPARPGIAPGVSVPRRLQLGVSQARGEYIARQDFDDCSYPERLRLQVELDAHPRWASSGHYLLVDERRGERYVRMPLPSMVPLWRPWRNTSRSRTRSRPFAGKSG
jgi:hypothetical protein